MVLLNGLCNLAVKRQIAFDKNKDGPLIPF